jgi:hypothetical protein
MEGRVRHFLGSDPCARPDPHPSHVWIARSRTEDGLRSGRAYRHEAEGLRAVLRRFSASQYVIVVDREGYGHEERFVKVGHAVDRWFEVCQAA